jgi:hypothetical protein
MTGKRKPPRWVVPFLRALERTGDVRAAAEDAGIDHSTAYARRKRPGDFADAWDAAMDRYAAAKEERQAEEIAALEDARSAPPALRHAQDERRPPEEMVGGGSQLKRAGHDRWGPRKEKLFFDELAATANVKRAAKAAGVSPNAVYQRRMRDAHFKAKWAAVLETGRAAIEMKLVEAANRSFDAEELDTGEVEPRVSVAEAIRITQAQGSKRQEPADPYDDPNYDYDEDMADIRERLIQKFQALRRRDRPELLAQGWSYDESWDREIPPGWIKGPDYVPRDVLLSGEPEGEE